MANYFLLPIPQWLLNSGAINAGGLIYTYQASSTTPLATYTDSTGATSNANPVVLDSAGRAQIWLSAAAYKFVVQTSAGAAIMTIDGYNPTNVNTTLSSLIDTGDLTLQQSTAATSGANQSSNNIKVQGTYWDGVTSQTDQWGIQDVLGTGSNPTSTLTVTHSGSSGTSTVSIPSVPLSLGNTLAVAGTTTLTGAVTLGSTINKLTLTQPASAATLTIANNKTFTANSSTTIAGVDGKTLTVNNSLTLAGTDSTTLTFQATGTVVNRDSTDTLSQKTLTGASSGNSVSLLNEQGPTGAFTGNSGDQVVYTYTLPANTMQTGKGIRVTAIANHSVGSAAISWKINFGGTAWTTLSITDTAIKAERFECLIFNNSGVTNAQHGSVAVDQNSGATRVIGSTSTAAIATTSNVTITMTFNVANTDQVTGQQFLVELLQ